MSKPSKLPAWDTTEVNAIEPDQTHKDEGWIAPGGVPEKPPFQTFNHWMNAVWKWIKELNQQGIVEWDGATTYDIDDVSKGSNGRIYMSLITANTNQDPTLNPTKWIEVQWRHQTITHDMASDANYTLTATQNRYGRVVITDTGVLLTVGRDIIVEDEQKDFILFNNTAQTLTVKTNAGTGIALLPGTTIWLLSDGTNVILASDGLEIASTAEAQAGTDNTKSITPLRLHETMFAGVEQTWQDVSGSRSSGVIYTNTTGRPIEVNVQLDAATNLTACQVRADSGSPWIIVGVNTSGATRTNIFVVPNGWEYICTGTVAEWAELR